MTDTQIASELCMTLDSATSQDTNTRNNAESYLA
jgi:hypothetical protein